MAGLGAADLTSGTPSMATPIALPSATLPMAARPITFPWIRAVEEKPITSTPAPRLAAITLETTSEPAASVRRTPSSPLPWRSSPVASIADPVAHDHRAVRTRGDGHAVARRCPRSRSRPRRRSSIPRRPRRRRRRCRRIMFASPGPSPPTRLLAASTMVTPSPWLAGDAPADVSPDPVGHDRVAGRRLALDRDPRAQVARDQVAPPDADDVVPGVVEEDPGGGVAVVDQARHVGADVISHDDVARRDREAAVPGR